MVPTAFATCCGVEASVTLTAMSQSPGYKLDAVAVNLYKAVRFVAPETSLLFAVHRTLCGAVPPVILAVGRASYTAPACPAVPEAKPHDPTDMDAPSCGGGSGRRPRGGMSMDAVALSSPAVAVTVTVFAASGRALCVYVATAPETEFGVGVKAYVGGAPDPPLASAVTVAL